jgi:hypothetical protein
MEVGQRRRPRIGGPRYTGSFHSFAPSFLPAAVSLSSAVNMALGRPTTFAIFFFFSSRFLALPNMFWSFPHKQPVTYVCPRVHCRTGHSLIHRLSPRPHLRDKLSAGDRSWNLIPMSTFHRPMPPLRPTRPEWRQYKSATDIDVDAHHALSPVDA